jgi:hypothetical protein
MTTTDPLEELTEAMFAGLELPRLRDLVDAGDLSSIDDFSVGQYARVAGAWDGPTMFEGFEVRREVLALMAGNLVQALTGQGPDYTEVDGEPHLRDPDGELHRVGPDELCHFERMVALLSDEVLARRFLALVPPRAREEAERATGQRYDAAFRDLTEPLE